MLLVGLTGGMASGKSTVSSMLQRHPIHLIDADVIARQVVQPGQPALEEIRAHFGSDVVRADGSLDRPKLGSIVFADPARRQALNRITHPYILQAENDQVSAIKDSESGAIVIIDAALLIEANAYQRVNRIIVVWVDHATQLNRLMARDGIGMESAEQRIAAQMPLDEKLTYADYVIDNRSDRAATESQVENLWPILCRERDARGNIS